MLFGHKGFSIGEGGIDAPYVQQMPFARLKTINQLLGGGEQYLLHRSGPESLFRLLRIFPISSTSARAVWLRNAQLNLHTPLSVPHRDHVRLSFDTALIL